MSVSVCLCVSVRDRIFETKLTRPIFTHFLCTLPMAVARSCSGDAVIRYVTETTAGGGLRIVCMCK